MTYWNDGIPIWGCSTLWHYIRYERQLKGHYPLYEDDKQNNAPLSYIINFFNPDREGRKYYVGLGDLVLWFGLGKYVKTWKCFCLYLYSIVLITFKLFILNVAWW